MLAWPLLLCPLRGTMGEGLPFLLWPLPCAELSLAWPLERAPLVELCAPLRAPLLLLAPFEDQRGVAEVLREPLDGRAPAGRAEELRLSGRALRVVREAVERPVGVRDEPADCLRSREWAAGRVKRGRAAAVLPAAAGLRAAGIRGVWTSAVLTGAGATGAGGKNGGWMGDKLMTGAGGL